MNAVSLKDVWARFDAGWVLEGVSLELAEGEILAVVGPNGGGKTSLLRVLLGTLRPGRGEVLVLGKEPSRARRRIGYLPQIRTQRRDFPVTVMDVVLMGFFPGLGPLRWPGRAERAAAMSLLEEMDLAPLAGHPFRELSGGQQQRVGIARALAAEPRLLLLDEPATGIDVVGQETFYRFLAERRDRRRMSVVMVSHDIGAVTSQVDRVACLNRRVHYYGPPEGAFTPEVIERTFGRDVHFLVHQEACPTCGERHG